MSYTVTQRSFNNVELSYIELYDTFVIPEDYLIDFEKKMLHKIFDQYSTNIQLGMQETIAPNGQTIDELFSNRILTRDEYIGNQFTVSPNNSRYYIKTIIPPMADVELVLDPSYDFTEIGVAMLDQNDDFVQDTNANTTVDFQGSSSVNGYITGDGFSADNQITGNMPQKRIIWEVGLARVFITATSWDVVFQLVVVARQYSR